MIPSKSQRLFKIYANHNHVYQKKRNLTKMLHKFHIIPSQEFRVHNIKTQACVKQCVLEGPRLSNLAIGRVNLCNLFPERPFGFRPSIHISSRFSNFLRSPEHLATTTPLPYQLYAAFTEPHFNDSWFSTCLAETQEILVLFGILQMFFLKNIFK